MLLPVFDIPDEFINKEDEIDGGKEEKISYLRHITYEGEKIDIQILIKK